MPDREPKSTCSSDEPRAAVDIFVPDCGITERGDELLTCLRRTVLDEASSTDAFERLVERFDLAVLGEGQARIVLHEPGTDWVAKLETYDTPYQNETETRTWHRGVPDGARDLFAPVLDVAPDFGYLIQRTVDQVGVSKAEQIALVEAITLEHGIDLNDVDADNFGAIDGDPVVFDYGTARPVAETSRWDSRRDAFDSAVTHIERRRE